VIQAHEYLDQNYPPETRQNITDLSISYQELIGELDLSDFVNLESLECSGNNLVSLNLNNCSQLEVINCSDNQFTNLDLNNCPGLIKIICANNQLTNLTLPKDASNLKKLNL
jgi:Leucine-rich repeat (LRR) protein